jgi:L-ribulokinase
VPCALGLDFGTASVRAVVVETHTGAERGAAVADYRHGVIEQALPGSQILLGADWALQHPGDYLESMQQAVAGAMRAGRVDSSQVVGIGIDFTSCTILPIDRAGQALASSPPWDAHPHAWVKLWKHHAAQPQADRINALAAARHEPFLRNYGGRTSSEWLFAKVLQVLEEDPAVFDAAAGWVEAGDWIGWQLTGTLVRNACAAGYKGFWNKDHGFPSEEFLRAVHPLLNGVREKLTGEIVPPGRRIGGLTGQMAAKLGLAPGTAVGAAIIDAHSAVPAATVVTPGRLVMVIGTSTCHMLLAERQAFVDGVAGVVADGIIEGSYGYEAGQAAVGDLFGWYARHVSGAGEPGGDVFAALEREADAAGPGGHGVIALDWWNGNRSVLMNADLSGLLIGLTLATTRGDVYRSLVEATGFGTRRILDAFAAKDVPATELIAVGGLAARSPLLLHIYADITNRPIRLAASANASATGAAMLGAVAAGESAGGHASFASAARQMAALKPGSVDPDPVHARIYDELYAHYLELHDHFGCGGSHVMRKLRGHGPRSG